MTDGEGIDHRREFLESLEEHPEVTGTDFTRDGFRTIYADHTDDVDPMDLVELGEEYGYSGRVVPLALRVVFEASPEGEAPEKVRVGGNRLSYPSDRNESSPQDPKKSSEGQRDSDTGEWEPRTAELREGETVDMDAHARRNLEQLRMGQRELEEMEDDDGDE